MTVMNGHSKRSPLQYPGGKFYARKILRDYFPFRLKEMASPFLGGGHIELELASQGVKVYGSDLFKPLTNFWSFLKKDPISLSTRVWDYHPLSNKRFYELQADFFNIPEALERAAVYYVLNRCSFSGLFLQGGSRDHLRFTKEGIINLRRFHMPNLEVENLDCIEAIRKHPDKFLYLDPPYDINQPLYQEGKTNNQQFDHYGLSQELRKRRRWVLSYNDTPRIRKLYSGYPMVTPEWTYRMTDKKSSELLILSR